MHFFQPFFEHGLHRFDCIPTSQELLGRILHRRKLDKNFCKAG
jgi:hypothetical protein